MNESFKTDPSLATSARAAKESGSYLCASNVTPTAVRFIVSVFLCLLCSCRMPSTQMTCSHFRKNRPKKRQKTAGLPIAHYKQKPAGSDLWPVNRCIPTRYGAKHSKYKGKREHQCGEDIVYLKTETKPFTQNANVWHFLEEHLS